MRREEGNLPSTRREQFFYCFRYFFGEISFASYMTFVFAIPLIVYSFFFAYQWTALLQLDSTTNEALMVFGSLYLLPVIPLTGLLGIGLSGAYTSSMRLSSNQVCSTKHYFYGIKDNCLSFFIYYSILGVFSYLGIFNWFFYSFGSSTFLIYFMRIFTIILFVFSLLTTTCASCMQVKYNMKKWEVLKNSFILMFKKFPLTFLIVVLSIAPLSLLFFFSNEVKIIVMAVFFLFYFGTVTLIITLRYQYVFDEVIHKESRPEEYHRGLASFQGDKKE